MNIYQWNEVLQFQNNLANQAFLIGFIAALLSVVPLCFLIILPHDVFVANNTVIREAVNKAKQLEKDNEDLRKEVIDHKTVIDALLTEKLNGQS